MSTGQSAVTLCGWGVKAGMVHSTCAWINDPSLTCAIAERLRGELLIIKLYTNRHFTLLCMHILLRRATNSISLVHSCNKAIVDIRTSPPVLPTGESLWVYILLATRHVAHLWANMASFTKPEAHKVLHCDQRRTEPRPQVTCKENFMKFGLAVLRYANGQQTDRQTNIKARSSQYFAPFTGRSNNSSDAMSLKFFRTH